jgi:tetratricopeptide (TPR) repeat protein
MKLILTLVSSFLVFQAFAQTNYDPVDRKKVEELISDSSAGTYYPKLVSRLKSYDSTLTLDEYRFVFQTDYSPYSANNGEEINSALAKGKYEQAIKYCDEIINKNPVSLRSYYYKLIALSKLKNDELLFEKLRNQYSRFLDAIASTGDGLTCKTAFKVISVSDEYDFMYRYLQIEKVNSQALQIPCDKISVSQSKYFQQDNVFFDVSESLNSMDNMFKK